MQSLLPSRELRTPTPSTLECPRCWRAVAVYVPDDQHLCRITPEGRMGVPFSDDPRADVAIRCETCRVTYRTSGRAVARALRKGVVPR
ncbi:MAG TPA: hypothetical protein VH373_12420 [Jatrophihabitantaceae bacterium]|jgi:hypothetical protein